ncbi:odorant-binding protein 59a [Ptiloglossa arizonensis]|uniref:odorant-binding protein 59a n=1 Tax=Ptiloglossa arizonensis TaxID=3350558 RepID=UPI003F9F5FB9
MTNFVSFALCCIILLFLNEGASLRCRSNNQQVDMQFQKVLKTCKKRYSGLSTDNEDSMSSERDSSESDFSSEEDTNDNNFFFKKSDRSSYDQSTNNQRYRSTNGNLRNVQNMKRIRKTNDRDSSYNNNTDREQLCIVQCFFNELNVVDKKGFPEQDLVIPLMIKNIQDPELKDFVEESIIECFHYLESSKREKCEFSQNLLQCLAEKGQEKCEDWEN